MYCKTTVLAMLRYNLQDLHRLFFDGFLLLRCFASSMNHWKVLIPSHLLVKDDRSYVASRQSLHSRLAEYQIAGGHLIGEFLVLVLIG